MATPDHPAVLNRQIPDMSHIAVTIGRAMRVLARFTNEGRRRNNRLISSGARVALVKVKRIIVVDCEREVANRGAADFFGRRVSNFASDPCSELVCEQWRSEEHTSE